MDWWHILTITFWKFAVEFGSAHELRKRRAQQQHRCNALTHSHRVRFISQHPVPQRRKNNVMHNFDFN